MADSSFFTEAEQLRIVTAIQEAEKSTSGEIRVHVEPNVAGDAFERAREVFEQLGMAATAQKNGVLFYVAYKDHKFVVLGDSGIHAKVTDTFWDEERQLLQEYFSHGKYCDGLCKAVARAGEKLRQFFPYQQDDRDELSNEISFGGPHDAQ
jgi:uncharacterized membrane protein